jgi:hypothetical protein
MSDRERWQANCPICKRDVGTASGRFATLNKPNSLDICKGSRRFYELCGAPGMVAGETCVLPKGHDGDAHLPMPKRST